jgi:hypothetical protein
MAPLTPKALDHRRAVLEHQEKLRAHQPAAAVPANDQLKMPLITLAKPIDKTPHHKRKRRRVRQNEQPKLGDL